MPLWWALLEICGVLLRQMIFNVATYRHLSDAEVARQPLSWLLDQDERVQRARWHDTVYQILATEVGAGRAIATAMGHAPDPLPTYEQVKDGKPIAATADDVEIPPWMVEFERVNVGRAIQSARSKDAAS